MNRKHFIREVTLLMVPIVLAAGAGFFFWDKGEKTTRLLESPVQVDKAYWTNDGRVLAYKIDNDVPTRTATTRFFSWKRDDSELLADVVQTGGRIRIFPSLDNKTWAAIDNALAGIILLDPAQGFTTRGEIPFTEQSPSHHTLFWISSDQVLDLYRDPKLSNSYKATVWNTKTGKEIKQDSRRANQSIPFLKREGIQAFRISPDSKYALVQSSLLLLGSPPAALAKTVPAGFKVSLISWPECRVIKQFGGDMWPSVSWSRDGKEVIALGITMAGKRLVKAHISRFNVSTKQEARVPLDTSTIETPSASLYFPHVITHTRFSPDNRYLLVPSIEAELWKWQIFSVPTGQKCGEISSPAKGVFSSAFWEGLNFSPDGRYLLQPLEKGIEIRDMNQFAELAVK